MKNVLVQVSGRYLCITTCEQILAANDKEKKVGGDEKNAHSFSSPLILTIEKELLKDKNSVWEDPKLLANLVKDGLSQMNHSEAKDVTIMVESFDLTCQEYQHIRGAQKVLNSLAIDRIRDFVGESVTDFSVIYKDYSQLKTKEVSEEVTAKAFAMPKALVDDLSSAFKDTGLNLIKIVPSEAAMLYAAQKTIYSFGKTVALISMDYCAVRVVIAKNGMPLYCHDFHSPIDEILRVIEDDKELTTTEAIDYLRTVGYGFQNECRNASAERRLEDIEENLIEEIVRNIRLVTMSLNIELDEILLSDFVAYIPHIRNYFVGFGLANEVSLISDSFNANTVIPEPSLKARDDFYKSGSFFIMNELMNSGTVFEDNMIYGLKAQRAKTMQVGGKVGAIGCAVVGGLLVVGLGFFGFFKIREAIDDSNFNNTKYNTPKQLIATTDKLEEAIANQSKDAKLLPRTKLYSEDVINELNTQVVDKVLTFNGYSLSHSVNQNTKLEEYLIPISGEIDEFNTFINLQNDIKADGFFEMNPAFTVGENDEKKCYTFSTSLMAVEKIATQEENSDVNISVSGNGSVTVETEDGTVTATAKED